MKPWLIGENNPYSRDPRYALYPEPERSAGGRLCRLVLGLEVREYLRRYERRNLLSQPKWSVPAAREAAATIREQSAGAPVVLLGARVARAFGFDFVPFTVVGERFAMLPHPSGLSRAWNDPGAFALARALVEQLTAPEASA